MSFGKSRTELACALSWFSHWDSEKRTAFADRVVRKTMEMESPEAAAHFLLEDLSKLDLTQNDGPSVFECQLRIFDNWFAHWPQEVRAEFFASVANLDPLIGRKLELA
jgi:hypothetical protein